MNGHVWAKQVGGCGEGDGCMNAQLIEYRNGCMKALTIGYMVVLLVGSSAFLVIRF
jgi:hypothetical protein